MKTANAIATLSDGRKIEYIPTVIGEGGFKRVYFSADRQSVVCLFKKPVDTDDPKRGDRLARILGDYNPTVNPATGRYFSDLFCWPTGIIVSPSPGILAPTYQANFLFGSGKWKGKEKEGKWFSSPKLRKLLPATERGHWKNYFDLCSQMIRGVRRMHMAGLAHSDLSCRNVLIDPPNGRCVIIDLDTLVVPGLYPPNVLGTPNYIAPEVIRTQHLPFTDSKRNLPCSYTDLHALAVLLYEYLLRRHPLRGPKVHHTDPAEDDKLAFGERALFIEHPSDTSNRGPDITTTIDHLGPFLKTEMLKAFVTGLHDPMKRPTATAWETALNRTADLLVPCANPACEEKWFIYLDGHKPKCPWCGTALWTRLPVLDFFYAPKPGQYRAEGHHLVGYASRALYPWHIRTDVRNNESALPEPQAMILPHGDKWIIQNLKLESMISPKGNPVPEGQACLLTDGEEIQLSRHEKGRMVCVRYTK